jgi:hypothetical protein
MAEALQIRTMPSGSQWYWEVVARDREVVARGIAETHSDAMAAAESAMSQNGDEPRIQF